MTQVTVKIKGFDKVAANLDRMARKTRSDAVNKALVRSARPMEAQYRSNAPSFLKRGVSIRQPVRVMRGVFRVTVGSRHPLAHIFEFGTKLRVTLGKGRYSKGARRGRIRALGFGRRAYDASVRMWFRLIGVELWKEVSRSVRR